jgi:hypothetical protein
MRTARSLINRISDKRRRAQFDEDYQQVEVPVVLAVQAGHRFEYDDLKDRLNDARGRLETLFRELANPKP